jgi:hypothetical protein
VKSGGDIYFVIVLCHNSIMTSSERHAGGADEILPDDIEKVIAHDLVPSGYPGSYTEKYLVRGYPHLVVRHVKEGEPIYVLNEAAGVFNELADFGIDALPYIPVEHDGEAYIVTLKVTGDALKDVLAEGDEEMAARVDDMWSKLISYVVTRKQNGEPYAGDIYAPDQYMYGTVLDDDEARVWLVDLGEYAKRFSEGTERYDYEREMLELVNTVLSLEDKLRLPLTTSRSVLKQSVGTMSVPRFVKAARSALKSGVPMKLPDDIIDF